MNRIFISCVLFFCALAHATANIGFHGIACSRFLTGESLEISLIESSKADLAGAFNTTIRKIGQGTLAQEIALFKMYRSPLNGPTDGSWTPFLSESGTRARLKIFEKEWTCANGSACNALFSWFGLGDGIEIPFYVKSKDSKLNFDELVAIKAEFETAYGSRIDMGVTGFDIGNQNLIVYTSNQSVVDYLIHDIPPQFRGVPVQFFVNPRPPKFDLTKPNSFCEKAGIGVFRVRGVPYFPEYFEHDPFGVKINNEIHRGNYCRTAWEEIPEPLRKTLEQLYGLTKKAADLFGLSVKNFVQPGMSIKILGNPVGHLASNSEIVMGVFPNWQGGDINSGVFVHELGHFISGNGNKRLPSSLRKLKNYKLFIEGVADWLAISVLGTLTTLDGGVTPPLMTIRPFETLNTFDLPRGYFEPSYSIRYVKEAIETNPAQGDTVEAQNERMAYKAITERYPNLPPVAQTPPLSAASDSSGLDTHLLSVPINSFFNTLKERLGRSVTLEFLQALKLNSDANPFDPQFECTIDGVATPDEDKVFVNMPTMTGFLKQIRNQLKDDGEKQIFDSAWKSHALDIGLTLTEKTISFKVDMAAKDIMRERFLSNEGKGSGIYVPGAKCHDPNYGIDMSCEVICVQVK